MKHQTILLTLLATAAFAVGCTKEKTPAQQIETIKAGDEQCLMFHVFIFLVVKLFQWTLICGTRISPE